MPGVTAALVAAQTMTALAVTAASGISQMMRVVVAPVVAAALVLVQQRLAAAHGEAGRPTGVLGDRERLVDRVLGMAPFPAGAPRALFVGAATGGL